MAVIDNIINNNRHELNEVIPLQTPYTVFLDPSNLCNFKCKFCATHSSNESHIVKKQNMNFGLYKKIIDDISEFPDKIKVLRLTGTGEPTINKKLPEMIKYAKQKNVADFIEIVTNGSLLNPELNRKLVDSGIDRIRISVEALNENDYKEIAGVDINFKDFINNIDDLYKNKGNCNIYIKTVDSAIKSKEDKKFFYKLFGDKCDQMFIDNVIPLWSDFDEINKFFDIKNNGLHGQQVQNIRVCPFIFYSFVINSDGSITCCCADWKHEFILGNVKDKSVKEIWNSRELRKFWIDMLKGNKDKYHMCKKCLYPVYDCNDNIDNYAEDILKKFEVK